MRTSSSLLRLSLRIAKVFAHRAGLTSPILFLLLLAIGCGGASQTITPPPPDTTPPTAPANLAANTVSSTQINLSWTASTDNVGVTGYRVERCQGSGCTNFSQVATPATTSFNDMGLTPSTSYSYRVRATDATGNLSGFSNTATATTQSSAPPPTQTPAFVNGQRQVSTFLAEGATPTPVTGACNDHKLSLPYHFCLADASLAGNAIISACTWQTTASATASMADDKSQSYVAAFATPPSDANQTIQIWYLVNSVAGVHELSLNFSGGAPSGIQCGAYQVQNVATANANCGTTSASGAGTSVAAGSFTPNAANCFVFQLGIADTTLPSGTWSAGGSFILQDVSTREGWAVQTFADPDANPIDPTLTMSSANGWVTAAIALNYTGGGSAPTGMYVRHISQNGLIDSVATYTFQFPCSGNLVVVSFNGNTGEMLSSVTGTNPTSTYTQVGSGVPNTEGVQQIWKSPDNIACTENHTITITATGNITAGSVMFYDVVGAATTSPLDSTLATDLGDQSLFASPLSTAIVTTNSANGILFCTLGAAFNGTVSFNPTGYQDNQDENNGWGHFHYTSQTPIQTSWVTDQRQALGGIGSYSDACAAFRSGPP